MYFHFICVYYWGFWLLSNSCQLICEFWLYSFKTGWPLNFPHLLCQTLGSWRRLLVYITIKKATPLAKLAKQASANRILCYYPFKNGINSFQHPKLRNTQSTWNSDGLELNLLLSKTELCKLSVSVKQLYFQSMRAHGVLRMLFLTA